MASPGRLRVRVVLLSHHPLVLNEMERLLAPARAGGPRFEVVPRRLETTLVPAVRRLRAPQAGVYVVDAHAHAPAVEALVAALRESRPRARVAIVGERFSERTSFPLLRLGVKGLITYAEMRERLAAAVAMVAAGGFWVPRTLLARFVDSVLTGPRGPRVFVGPGAMSPRERDVLDGLLQNLANKEIAQRINLSERTVKFHVSKLLAKFGVRSRSELILRCLQG